MLDRLKGTMTLAVVLSTGILLATGWLLTWARLASEGIPSENILAALPHGYFIQVALHATFAPLIMLMVLGIPWVYLCVERLRHPRGDSPTDAVYPAIAWCGFGALLSAVFWIFRLVLNSAGTRYNARYLTWELLATLMCVICAGVIGHVIADFALPDSANSSGAPSASTSTEVVLYKRPARLQGWWALARPFVAATLLLCVLTASVLRIVDARFTKDVLPLGQAILATACEPLTGGIPIGDGSEPNRCLIGGFDLGENGDWVYLVRREDPCPHKSQSATGPQLIALRIADVQELVVLSKIRCSEVKHAAGS